MTSIQIIDDVPTFREELELHLERSFEAQGTPAHERPRIRADWRFVWSLINALEKGQASLTKGDIVITDLYSAGFWDEVPKPTLHSSVSQLPDDPQNLYRAAIEVTTRYFPRLHDRGAYVIVLTYVPTFLERECGYQAVADDVRRMLKQEGRILVEKIDRDVANPENYVEVVREVHRLLNV